VAIESNILQESPPKLLKIGQCLTNSQHWIGSTSGCSLLNSV